MEVRLFYNSIRPNVDIRPVRRPVFEPAGLTTNSHVWYDTVVSKRVYIETTVASYFTARPSRDVMVAGHQKATRELWPKFASTYEAYVSALVYEEARKGDPVQAQMRLAALKPFGMLDVDEEARTFT